MNILALETATEACSVALLSASGESWSDFEVAPRRHTELLPRMLDSVLQRSGVARERIDYISFGNGPGAFTGVRIAAASAQGMAIGLDVPLLAVSTLAVLAQHAMDQFDRDRVQPVLDARMGEIYSAVYARDPNSGLAVLVGQEVLVAAADIRWQADVAVGSGVLAGAQAGAPPGESVLSVPNLLPHAEALAKLARASVASERALAPDRVEINYLRNQVAWRN